MGDQLWVAVVGLGKIGLPLAAQFASKGAYVIGCDADEGVVGAINDGACPVLGEPGLEEALASARSAGLLRATSDTTAAVRECAVTVLIVPVGIDEKNQTDFRHLDAAAAAVGAGLRQGSLIILETTVPVGATRNRLGQALTAASGLKPGEFLLAYSPERVSSGRIFRDLATYPKLVGGLDVESAEATAAFYRHTLDAEVVILPDLETAEFTKLAESVYRDVNIALANELARAAESLGVDYATAAQAANSQPYSHLHAPGVGVGGHCIPVYPYFLLETSPEQRLVRASREINDSMADHARDLLQESLRSAGGLKGKTVLILGLSYRGGVKEATLSSTHLLASSLRAAGARVLVHDPLFSAEEIRRHGYDPASLPLHAPLDAVVLQAAHPEYRDLDIATLKGCRVFLDGRGALDRGQVEAAGMRYLAIGSGK
jgi:nucleotide sugar dehydrogenase